VTLEVIIGNRFQTYGPVEGVEIMTDPETRYSRGFAFVEMTNHLEAKKAISDLNGMIFRKKPIRVEESRTRLATYGSRLERYENAR
jgi:RNA recognition motif-containing protein